MIFILWVSLISHLLYRDHPLNKSLFCNSTISQASWQFLIQHFFIKFFVFSKRFEKISKIRNSRLLTALKSKLKMSCKLDIFCENSAGFFGGSFEMIQPIRNVLWDCAQKPYKFFFIEWLSKLVHELVVWTLKYFPWREFESSWQFDFLLPYTGFFFCKYCFFFNKPSTFL